MFGKKWRIQLQTSLEFNIDLMGLIEEISTTLPKEKQKEIEHKVEVLMAKHTKVVNGKMELRK